MVYSIKILLFSDNTGNAHEIKKILSADGFGIQITNSPKDFESRLDSIKLIILNFTKKNTVYIADIKKALKDRKKEEIAKIALLGSNQSELLFENGIIFNDFCFTERIKEELALRVKAVLLRIGIYPPKNSILVGGLILNLDKYELSVNGTPVELTFKEFELLKLLLENQNKVFTRNKLLSIIWEYDFYGGSRTIDVHVRRLRSKIPPPYNLMLKTVRNVGYIFSPKI